MCSHDDWFEQRRRADRLERALLELIAHAQIAGQLHADVNLTQKADEARREHAASFRESPK